MSNRVMNRFNRAAARARAAETAPAEVINPRALIAEIDKHADEQIAQSTTAEARDWLDTTKYPNHAVMEMSIEKARAMVAGFYERGAERVYVLDPTTLGDTVLTAQFAVKLPQDPAQRKQCFEWEASQQEGEDPSPDLGQKYLLITTD